jgi:hypothetical protein
MSLNSKAEIRTKRANAASPWASALGWLIRPTHYRAVHVFRMAAERRDAARLGVLLHPDVAIVVDSGESDPPAIRVVRGTYDAIPLLIHGLGAKPGVDVADRSINGQAGFTLSRDGKVTAAINVDFTGGLVSMLWIRLQPEMLRHGNKV